MQPTKTKISLAFGALCLGATGLANAASQSFDITVTTLPDVSITPVTQLSYGTNVITTAGGVCLMDADVPGDQAAGLMQYDAGGAISPASFGALTGNGCVTGGTGTPGKYRLTGLAGATVNITIAGASNADFSFVPNNGCIVNYGNTNAADTCTAYSAPVTALARKLAGTVEDLASPTAGAMLAPAGQLMFTVGGTITIGGTALTPNQAYTQNFPVTVVY